ncbi:ABA4-like family protein [Actinoplanes sp. N902-109]|uniref:ABA4-like family protein n=1 Tax=Actinoplanes sp. (strain N902-109) TaxID=649831 RepID=UPI00032964B9|nr:ABA4-like family protein [Actinoplanes sp. N902-109]AGL15298.1 hypothetical protein L083_1788 [Actinoplanes sp. N902-109]
MSETLFSLTFAVAAPFWAMMIVLPRWAWTRRIVASPWIVLPPVLIYAIVVAGSLGDVLPAVISPTLPGVRELLGTSDGATAGWAHLLAFDLFAGRWAYLDSRERGIPPLVMAPILLLTILLGPLGLLTFLLVRRRWPDPTVGRRDGETDLGRRMGESGMWRRGSETGVGRRQGESGVRRRGGESGVRRRGGEAGLGRRGGEAGEWWSAGGSGVGDA